MTRVASFVVLVAIIVAMGILFWRVMSGFFIPLFLSLLLLVMFRPLHDWLLERIKRPRVTAGLTAAAVTLIVLLPAGWLAFVAASQGVQSFTRTDVSTLQNRLQRLRDSLGLQLPAHYEQLRDAYSRLQSSVADDQVPSEDIALVRKSVETAQENLLEKGLPVANLPLDDAIKSLRAAEAAESSFDRHAELERALVTLQNFRTELLGGPALAWIKETANPTDARLQAIKAAGYSYLRKWLVDISGTTLAVAAKLILGFVIVIVSLYFFLLDGPGMVKTFMWLSPLDDRHEQELLDEFSRVSRAVVVATLLSAIVQSFLAAIGFWLAGLPSVVLLMMVTLVFAMIPFVGAAAVWIPACIYLYVVEARLAAALVLAIYGALIVSTADNVIKPWVLHGQSNLHPLLALLSVLGGVQALGPIGILIGPMVVAFLQTLLKILHRELSSMESPATQS